MNPIARALRAVDRLQQRSGAAAFVVGVVKKYGDDRGGQLTGLITFYAFMSFFPLTLIVVTVTSFVAQANPAVADRIRESTLAQFPVVGTELAAGERALPGSGLGLAVGFIALLWAGFGVTQALQYAFHEVWHVPHKNRPPFLLRMGRGVLVFVLMGCGVLLSAVLGLFGSFFRNSMAAGVLGMIGAFILTLGLYFVMFWLLSPRSVPLRDLLPGAVIAAFGWQVLQTIGLRLVTHQLRRSSQLYGVIGAALGLIGFLLLGTQVLIYSLEVTVVRVQKLWPRSILQPPLTGPDKQMLATMAKQEERRPEEHIDVHFHDDASGAVPYGPELVGETVTEKVD